MKIRSVHPLTHLHWNQAVSQDSLRPVMTGVYFDLVNEAMVATNSHLLLISPIKIEWSESEKFLKPSERKKLIEKYSKILPVELFNKNKYMGDYKYYAFDIHYDFSDEKYAKVFNGPEEVFKCRYIDGVFPNYKAVIPTETEPVEKIGLNWDMFQRIYKAIPFRHKTLVFQSTGKNKPILFKHQSNFDFHGVIMPTIGDL